MGSPISSSPAIEYSLSMVPPVAMTCTRRSPRTGGRTGDPIAATAIGRRLGVPRRLIDIIEGESLVNDGTALVLLRTAIVAAVASSFSVWDAGWHLAVNIVGGIAVGLAVGYPIRRLRRVLDNPPLEVTIAFLTGYFAFLPGSAIHVSGVLAVVTAGV